MPPQKKNPTPSRLSRHDQRLELVGRLDVQARNRSFVGVAYHIISRHVEERMAGLRLRTEFGCVGGEQNAACRVTPPEERLGRPGEGQRYGAPVAVERLEADGAIDPARSSRFVPVRVGDGFTALDGEGVQPAAAATIRLASRPNSLRLCADTFNDLTDGLAERNALH